MKWANSFPGVDSSEGKLRNRLSFEKVVEGCGLKLLPNMGRAGFLIPAEGKRRVDSNLSPRMWVRYQGESGC